VRDGGIWEKLEDMKGGFPYLQDYSKVREIEKKAEMQKEGARKAVVGTTVLAAELFFDLTLTLSQQGAKAQEAAITFLEMHHPTFRYSRPHSKARHFITTKLNAIKPKPNFKVPKFESSLLPEGGWVADEVEGDAAEIVGSGSSNSVERVATHSSPSRYRSFLCCPGSAKLTICFVIVT